MNFRRFAVIGAALACLAGTSCHEGGSPAASPTRGFAGSPGDLDVGAPAIRFAMKAEPMLGLTASDGTGLRLAVLSAQAVVDGSVAFTELRLTFDNPESRTLEGRFRIALPSGASLQRFAMKIGADWQESEVVELTAAREAYEDALHRKQDPALLENAAGNEFSARVFPIPANARKELIVSYVQELRQSAYVLPLRGLPEVGQLDAQVTVVGAAKQAPRLTLRDDKPSVDMVVDLAGAVPERSGDAPTAIRAGELVVARVRPQAESKPEPLAAAIVLVDTSASRALGEGEELRALAVIVARAVAAHGTLTVATFDQQVTPVFDGDAARFGNGEMTRIKSHGALGASNLEAALAWASAAAKKTGRKRVVLLTDGVATAGATDAKGLTAAVSALRGSGIERLDAVATGGIRDDAALLRLVRNLLPHDGVVALATDPPAVLARRLDEATRSGIAVQLPGASWSWPTKLDGVQAGDEVSIYAELPAGKPIALSVDGKPAVTVAARATARPLVERAVAQAQVASLLERELSTHQDLKKEITALAVRHRVLTPYTAMLVLETEADYARFRIDRRAPPEVLAIADGAIVRVPRALRGAPGQGPIDFTDERTGREGEAAKDSAGMPPRNPGRPAVAASAAPAATASPRPPPSTPPADAKADAPKPKRVAVSGVGSASDPSSSGPRAPGGMAARPRSVPSPQASPPPPPPSQQPAPAAAQAAAEPRATGSLSGAAVAKKPSRAAPAPEEQGVSAARASAERAITESSVDRSDTPMAAPPSVASRSPEERARRAREHASDGEEDVDRVPAYTGRFKEVMDQLAQKDVKAAFESASAWRGEEPGDVMALVALGETSEALGAPRLAARAYGSIVDLFPNRADLRRFAGERLERLGDPGSLELAIDTFQKARADRPDHPASHRLLAMAYLRAHQPQKAFEVLVVGLQQPYPIGRFRGVDRILREDLGLAAAAWMHDDPKREGEIRSLLQSSGGALEEGPSLRFVLVWETDANDVDFHIYDAEGNHAFYSRRELASGGELYADVTTGYGPECFTVRGAREERAGPYKLQAHYYSRGPMGYGMGKLQVIEHDGKGDLTFDERPFVVMNDHAFVDLGTAK